MTLSTGVEMKGKLSVDYQYAVTEIVEKVGLSLVLY